MSDRDDIKEYYASLLILQYRNKPKARATIKLLVDLFLADGLVLQLPDILDIDTAEGAQLDIIGKILGCQRTVQGIVAETPNFFQFHIDESSYGFSTVGDPVNAQLKSAQFFQDSVYTLTDTEYRPILFYKAMLNVMSATMKGIDDALYKTFGYLVYMQNNQDGSINWVISSKTNLSIQALDKLSYLRPPMGVGFRNVYIIKGYRAFGFATKKNLTNVPKTIGGFTDKNGTEGGEFFTKLNIYDLQYN